MTKEKTIEGEATTLQEIEKNAEGKLICPVDGGEVIDFHKIGERVCKKCGKIFSFNELPEATLPAEKQTSLVAQESKPLAPVPRVTEKDIDDFLFGSSTKLTDAHKLLFKKTAVMFGLNPFKREIYAVPFVDRKGEVRMSLITGYEVYLKRAEGSGRLNGWKVETSGAIPGLTATVTINRKDWSQPFVHTVHFSEYRQNNQMWDQKPVTMLKKVATAQAFRLAFPEDLAGIPYTSDELPPEMNGTPTLPPAAEQKKLPEQKPVTIDLDAPISGGKFIGKYLKDTPTDYLFWVAGQCTDQGTKDKIRKIINDKADAKILQVAGDCNIPATGIGELCHTMFGKDTTGELTVEQKVQLARTLVDAKRVADEKRARDEK